uniref:Zgc:103586 n=1 Tax=Sinocyclocheilus rhinocerous TaxID=307959 RepID=A0A673M2Z4_9TELE
LKCSHKDLELAYCITTGLWNDNSNEVAELVAKCLQAREMAYCSYSGFPVGAAQHDSTNCDTEKSFHLTNSDIKDSFVGPCGACRQVLMEFGTEWDIYLTKPDGIIGRPVSESSCL